MGHNMAGEAPSEVRIRAFFGGAGCMTCRHIQEPQERDLRGPRQPELMTKPALRVGAVSIPRDFATYSTRMLPPVPRDFATLAGDLCDSSIISCF